MKKVAMASPNVPPAGSPRFHPKYMPDITYPTPSPHNMSGPSVRFSCVGGKLFSLSGLSFMDAYISNKDNHPNDSTKPVIYH